MRNLMIIAIAATALAACGETQTQRTTTGALSGGAVGAVAGGPVGAVVGAGVGAVAGANRDKIDETTDKAAANAKQEMAEATDSDKAARKTAADNRTNDNTAAAGDDSMQKKMAMDRAGPTNTEVKSAQEALQDLNLYSGPIDGLYGVKTIRAVNEFQKQKDLARTGTLNERTQRELQLALNTDTNTNSSNNSGTMQQRSQAPSDNTSAQTGSALTTSTQAASTNGSNAKTQ